MLVSSEELRFDFKGAQFNLGSEKDLKLLGWIFNQFLYGEVTGIQCGHWLYHAPHLNAAAFLARQASEEISHVRRILRVLFLLGQRPTKPHRAVQFLSTGMMGGSWAEHVALEMALGEGLVLTIFYAMADTLPDQELSRILTQASEEEEKHVEFGERESLAVLKKHPGLRPFLLTLAWIQYLVLSALKRSFIKKIEKEGLKNHPVLSQFDAFYSHVLKTFELRIQRLGLSPQPMTQLGFFQKLMRIVQLPLLPLQMSFVRFKYKTPLLTKSYLQDPIVQSEFLRSAPDSSGIQSDQKPNAVRSSP